MMEALANQKWVNAQLWAQQVLGKPVQPTCKGTSVKDHLYLSPELAYYLVDVQVQQDWFSDHAVLFAQLSDLGTPPRLPLWREPRAIDWSKIKLPLPEENNLTIDRSDTTKWYRQIASELEARVDRNLAAQDNRRCQTMQRVVQPLWKFIGSQNLHRPQNMAGHVMCNLAIMGVINNMQDGFVNLGDFRVTNVWC